jgi:tripartite-type tricarboxylate transporter receptor subunit TctC
MRRREFLGVLGSAAGWPLTGVPGYELDIWFGLMAPRGTPKPILDKVHHDVAELLDTPEAKAKLQSIGVEFNLTSREEHAKVLHADIQKFSTLVSKLKLGEPATNPTR